MKSGIIITNKPVGLRSTTYVNMIKHMLGEKVKVGHAGTLDGPASGLLLILVGTATRMSQYLMSLPKMYEVSMILGQRTDTDDFTGSIISTDTVNPIVFQHLQRSLISFQGTRMQVPPLYSAVKVDGKRAHSLSRDGKAVKITPRPICVERLAITAMTTFPPTLTLRIWCHKGTYIRSIVRDLGEILGCGAYVSSLKRIRVGSMTTSDKRCVQDPDHLDATNVARYIQPIRDILPDFHTYDIPADHVSSVKNGRAIEVAKLVRKQWGRVPSSVAIALTSNGFISMSRLEYDGQRLLAKPETNLFLEDEER
jgi:tRNA pseudouridine(55) synthase